MHSSCIDFFSSNFSMGGGGGGKIIFIFLLFPTGSFYVPFKFPMGSHQVPNIYAKGVPNNTSL
jgi:hypothetical protein